MKKCLVCEAEISKDELCKTCEDFMKSKYKEKFEKEVQRFRESRKFIEKWRSSEKEVRKK